MQQGTPTVREHAQANICRLGAEIDMKYRSREHVEDKLEAPPSSFCTFNLNQNYILGYLKHASGTHVCPD